MILVQVSPVDENRKQKEDRIPTFMQCFLSGYLVIGLVHNLVKRVLFALSLGVERVVLTLGR